MISHVRPQELFVAGHNLLDSVQLRAYTSGVLLEAVSLDRTQTDGGSTA